MPYLLIEGAGRKLLLHLYRQRILTDLYHLWQKAVILSLDPEISKVPDALHLQNGYLDQALKGEMKPIKTVVQEGKVIHGIGNAYADEILYAAKLSPFFIAGKIPEPKIKTLTKAIKDVLTEAEAHIRKNFPDTITEKERDFLKVHLPKHKVTPKGEIILVAEVASRKTHYTEGQDYLSKVSYTDLTH